MKQKGKIAKRTLGSIFVLMFVLIISVSTVLAFQVQSIILSKYSQFAHTYTKAAARYINGDTIEHYLATGEKDTYYNEINRYLNATAEEANIAYFYVFVPGEDSLTYIWDAEPKEEPMELLETEEYSDDNAQMQAKELFKSNQTENETINYYHYNDKLVVTGSSVLNNSAGTPVAIVAADLYVVDLSTDPEFINAVLTVVFSTIAIMSISMLVYYKFTKKTVVQPIIKLHKATDRLVEHIENNEEFNIDITTNDEIEMLACSIMEMDDKLRDYIKQNAAITAEKERIGTELELATRLQADMLPNIFPAFPEKGEFDIYASMKPAKEVGGDFYDFFLVDDNHLAMVMADVSGKGIPAALFMMMSKMLIQNVTKAGKSPGEVLETVNNQICANNREEMFVTVWLGILDLDSGILTAANAGHEKPMFKTKNGDFASYKDKSGFVIGAMENVTYTEYQLQFESGSKLFVFTDGVPEATDENDRLFGMKRTCEALNAVKDDTPENILRAVKESVDSFVGETPQFDDLTMLCLEYIGKQDNEITLDATLKNVGIAIDFVAAAAEKCAFSFKALNQLQIAADEIISNVARYAYENKTGPVQVRVSTDQTGFNLTVTDSGIAYNPLLKEDPDVSLSADERGIGGYGIFLVKKMMDDVSYERKGDQNILTIRKNFDA